MLSIAANAVINGVHETKCWIVKDSSPEAQEFIISEFINFLMDVDKRRVWSEEACHADNELQQLIEIEQGRNKKSPHLAYLRNKRRVLKKYQELNCFGYNSSRYDLQIMMSIIMVVLEKKKLITAKKHSGLSVLKKGTAYFSLKFGNVHFKDLLAFTVPMPLEKYMRTWTSTEIKQVIYIIL